MSVLATGQFEFPTGHFESLTGHFESATGQLAALIGRFACDSTPVDVARAMVNAAARYQPVCEAEMLPVTFVDDLRSAVRVVGAVR